MRTAKQLANLRPAKKGEIRNPKGVHSHGPITQMLANLKKFTLDEYRVVIEQTLMGNLASLEKIVKESKAEDSPTSALQVGVATSILKAISRGDHTVFEALASRIIGKIPDKLEVNAGITVKLDLNDKGRLKAMIAKLRADVT